MTTRGAIARERLERLLRVATCLAQCGYGAQVGALAATARAFRGDAQLWAAQARHRGPAGRTLLMHAVCADDVTRLDFLLAHSADVEAQAFASGDTALIGAGYLGLLQCAVALLERGRANVNAARGPDGVTALMSAAQEGHLDLVKLLVARGADANQASHDGQTSLMAACNGGHLEVARCLVEVGGANVNAVKTGGGIALGAASFGGHLDCVRYLIERGATAASAALVEACAKGHLEVARYLLEHGGAKPDAQMPGNGMSALLWACKSDDRLELVRLLVVRGGAAVNAARNDRGVSALMGASMNGSLQIVKYLLLHGADRDAQCLSGLTALDYADGQPLVQAALRA